MEALESRLVLSTSIPLSGANWTALGPAPILNGQIPGSQQVTGRISALAAHPTNANIIYVASAGGGVWKTTDGGVNWSPKTDTQQTLFMGSIAIAPSNPNVIYAGTGEANNSLDSYYGRGVLRSLDGGTTWTLFDGDIAGDSTANRFDRRSISKIVVDPIDANRVYAAVAGAGSNGLSGNRGIWRSTDGGATWTNTTSTISTTLSYNDLVIDPTTSGSTGVLYAAVGSISGAAADGVYKSSDGGSTWALAGNFPATATNGRISLAIAPSSSSTVYAAIQDTSTFGLQNILKTTDSGLNWNPTTLPENYMSSQGWYDQTIAVDPTNPNVVYAGGAGDTVGSYIVKTSDGGTSWTTRLQIRAGTDGHGPHADHHGIGFDANGKLLMGTDGGIWRLDNPNVGSIQWANLNGNLPNTALNTIQFTGIALHPTDANIAYGGSQDNGTEKFNDSLGWTRVAGGDGGYVRVSHANPNTVYHEFQRLGAGGTVGTGFLERSDNGGASWTAKTTGIVSTDPANFYIPFVMDPSNAARLLLGTNRVYETVDSADNWTPISANGSGGWLNNGRNITSLAAAPSDVNTIYAAAGYLHTTTNHGTAWSSIDIMPTSPIWLNYPDLIVDPLTAATAYVVVGNFRSEMGTGTTGQVWRTTNSGATWSSITGDLPDLPAWSIELDGKGTVSTADDVLYVGNDDGVYISTNLGVNWTRYGAGLPRVQVVDLERAPTLGILAAGTHGRGLWEIAALPIVQFSLASFTTDENAGNSMVVTLARPNTGLTSQVQVSITGGTAIGGSDYNNSSFPLTVTFNPADATQTVTVPILNDTLVEGTQTINFQVTAVSNATIGTQSTTTLNITDADSATAAFQSSTTTVGEDAATPSINAVLTMLHAGDTLESAASFRASATNGSAENADYDQGSFPKTITFAASSSDGAVQNTTFDPTSDTWVEGNETVTLTLSVLSGVVSLGGQTTNVVTISDADAASVAWDSATASTAEDAAVPTIGLTLTMLHPGDLLENAAVFSVSATNGTAENTDYDSGSFPKIVTFPVNSGQGSIQTTTLDAVSDTLVEGDETVTLTLQVTSGPATVGAQSTTVMTITDSDSAVVGFQSATRIAGEDAPPTNVAAVLRTLHPGDTLENAAVFSVTAANGTAENQDYDQGAFPKSITFPASSADGSLQSAAIDPTSDIVVEGDETVTLTLGVTSGVVGLDLQTTTVVTISDADTATVSFQSPTTTVIEDVGTPNITVVLTMLHAGDSLENAAVFSVTASNSSAENSDYDRPAFPKSVTFPVGSVDGTTQNTTLVAVSDTLVEGNETVTLTLVATSGPATPGSQPTNLVTIQDADTATVAFQSTGLMLGENGLPGTITAVLTMLHPGDVLEGPAVMSVSATNNTAESTDYDSGAYPKTLIFPANSGNGVTQDMSFDPAADTLVEGDETVTLTLGVSGGAATVGTPNTHLITIVDADTATVNLQGPTLTIGEDAAPLNIAAVINLSNPGDTLENPAVFSLTAINGTAENADYDQASFPKTFTFPITATDGSTQTVTLDPASDTLVEGEETVTVTLSLTSGPATLGLLTSTSVTILDADTGVVAFQSSTTTIGEDDPTANIIAVLTTQHAGDKLENAAVFNITAVNGTAENDDYDQPAFPKTITFPANAMDGSTQSVTFDPTTDTTIEGDETVTLTLVPLSSIATLGAISNNNVNIVDADGASVSFQTATTTVGEDGATATITAVLTMLHPGDVLENDTIFNINATNGTAENADFDQGSFPKSMTFPANSGDGTTRTTTFDPASDNLVEGSETVTLALQAMTPGTVAGSQSANTVTITDADSAVVTFQSTSSSVGEDAAPASIAAVITTLTPGDVLENDAVFNILAVNGTAENADYDQTSFPKVLTFPANSVDGSTQNTTLDPTTDILVEGSETVTLTLFFSSGATTVGAQDSHTVTINDADSASVAFQFPTTTVGEDDVSPTINVVLLTLHPGDVLENAAVFNVSAANVTTENSDYDQSSFPKTITFNASSIDGTVRNAPLDPNSDIVVEGTEALTLTLGYTSGVVTLGTQLTNTVTIIDADSASVAFQSAVASIGEDAATANLGAVLTMLHVGDVLESAAVFNISATNGTAENADYDQGSFPKTITFPANSGDGTIQNTTLDPASDTLVEGDETVTLTMTVNSGVATVGPPSTRIVTINDADSATVIFLASSTTVGEDDPSSNVTVVLTTLHAGDRLENAAVLGVKSTNGTAENSDYDQPAFPKSVTFPANSVDGATESTTFDPASDTLVEGTETVSLTLTFTSGTVTVGSQNTHDFTITDADSATVAFQTSTTTTGEDAAAPNVTAVLTTLHPGDSLENSAAFLVSSANGTAENTDYDRGAFPKSITFPANAADGSTQDTSIDPTSDVMVEGDETVTLTLAVVSGVVGLGSQTSHEVTITDADSAIVVFQASTTTVGEDSATPNVTALLTTLPVGNFLENAAVFSVSATNGTAENADYDQSAFPKTIVFPANATHGATQTTTFDPASDTLVEGSETVTLTLSVTGSVVGLGAQTTNVVTIIDGDAASVSFQSPTTNVGEDAASPSIAAVLTMLHAGDTLENGVTFNVTPTNANAENADYDQGAFPKLITFNANAGNGATQTTTFDPASDILVEGNEFVTLTLSVSSGVATVGTQPANVITIADADSATVAFQSPATIVGEDAATPNINAVLTTLHPGDMLENAAVFNVTAANGTAENDDYDQSSYPKTITFAANSADGSVQSTTFDPASDTLVEGTETVTLTLGVNTGVALVGSQNSNSVAITDADSASVTFQGSTTTVGEDDATPNVTAVLTMLHPGDTLESDANFRILAANGTAENADYDQGSFPKLITFPASSASGATQDTTFDPESDILVEGDELVTLFLTLASGVVTVGAQNTNAVTITDADSATVAFQSATTSVIEDAATFNVTAVLTTLHAGDMLEDAAEFTVTAANGNAENADYDQGAFPKTITFPADAADGSTQNTTFDPTSDNLVEGNESVTLTLAVSSGVVTLGTQATNLVTITDSDSATVSFQSAATNVGEDAATPNIAAVLAMLHAGDVLESAAVFSVTATNGTAENSDYDQGSFPKTITFAANASNGSIQNTTIDPSSDTVVEGNEVVTLTLAVSSGVASVGSQGTNDVTITDADNATVSFQTATTTVGEDAATPNISARLTMLHAGDTLESAASFNVTSTNGTAENSDYDQGSFPKTLTFPANALDGATQTTTFDPASDTFIEGDESVTLTLVASSGGVSVGAQSTNTVTVVDADSATVAFQSSTTIVAEDSSTPSIIAVLIALHAGDRLENAAVFSVTATNGSTENADYNQGSFPDTITFAANSLDGTTQASAFDPASDILVEGNELVTLTLGLVSGVATLGTTTTDLVTITDADTATVSFQSTTTTVGEDAPVANILVRLTTLHSGDILENPGVFSVAVGNGTAENADYDQGSFPKTITFPANAADGSTQNLPFNPASDNLVEGNETATLTLSLTSGVAIVGSQPANFVVINDADSATVAFQTSTTNVGEDASTANINAVLTMLNAGDVLENAATFRVSATNGTAESIDYDQPAFPKTITFPPNSPDGSTQSATFDPVSDQLVEGAETATLTLSLISGIVSLGSQTTNLITIADTDTATVAFQSATTAVGEDDAPPSILAVLTTLHPGDRLESAAVFNVTATSINAENSDYDPGSFPKTVTFATNTLDGSTQSISIDPESDQLIEGSESVTLTLAAVSGVVPLGAQTTNLVTITDTDSATISVVVGQAMTEGGGAQTVTVRLNTQGGTFEDPLTVTLTAVAPAGTESNDGDFGALGSFDFAAGAGNNSNNTSLSFTPVADNLVEGNEIVTFTPSGATLDGQVVYNGLDVTLTDEDTASISIVANQSFVEDGGAQPITVRLTTPDSLLENALTVSLTAAVAAGAEVNDATFGALGSFSFAAGAGNGTDSTSVTFTPTPDLLVEGNELVTLTSSGSSLDGTITYSGNDATITDSDSATISIADQSVTEDGGGQAITVRLATTNGSTLENALTLSLTAAAAAGTETNDAAFSSLGTINFAAGTGTTNNNSLTFTPITDNLVEGTELATLTPSGPTLNGRVTYTPNDVPIIDADSATVLVVSNQTAAEDGGARPITVRLTTSGSTLERALVVTLNAAAGTGTEAADATFGDLGNFTFAAGAGNNTNNTSLSFFPNSDALVEGNEVAVLTPTGSTLDGQVAYTASDVSIIDADSAAVSVTTNQAVAEDGNAQAITVVLTTGNGATLENPLAVSLNAQAGAATEAVDATFGSLGNFTFAAGAANNTNNASVTFTPAQDSLVEGNELTIVTPSGSALDGQIVYTASDVTITDADNATVLVVPSQTVDEDGGAQSITVRLSTAAGNTLENALTVSLNATAAAGTEGADGTFGALGTFTFAVGAGNNAENTSLTFTPAADTLVEGNELVAVSPSGNTLDGHLTYASNNVTISDADNATVAVAAGQSVNEDGGAQSVTIVLTSGENLLENAVTVTLSAELIAGTEAADGTFGSLGSFDFPAGTGDGTEVTTLKFTPAADTLVEGSEKVRLVPTGNTLDGQLQFSDDEVTITDGDSAAVSVLPGQSLTEDGGAQAITVQLTTTGGSTLENSLTVSLNAALGTGAETGDVAIGTVGSFNFAAGASNNATDDSITLTPVSDTLVEGNELLTLTAAGDTLNGKVTYVPSDVTITDADAATVTVLSGQSVAEDSGAQAIVVRLTTTGGSTLENALGVSVTAAPATGTEASDANFGVLGTFNFAVGVGNNTDSGALRLTPAADNFVEGNEQATLTPSGNDANGQVSYLPNTVTITDADTANVAFAATNSTFAENAGVQSITLILTTGVGNRLENAAAFSVGATNITAENSDYDQGAFPKAAIFAAGSLNGDLQQVTFTPAADSVVEGNESVELDLTATSGAATVGTQSTNAITINDANQTTVSIQATDAAASETATDNAEFQVTLANNIVADVGGIIVNYTVAGTASATDYTALSGIVTIPAGASSAKIDLTGISDDAIVERSETVIITLTSTDNSNVTIAPSPSDTATANIQDNDSTTVSVSANDASASETATDDGQFMVTLDNSKVAPTGGIIVNYTVTGSATPTSDYRALTGSVTIPAGSSSATIEVTAIVDDALFEGDETVIVTLRSADHTSVTVSTSNSATVTIHDNEEASQNQAPTNITVSNLTVDENASGATIGQVVVTDPDAGQTHTFTLSDNRFEITGSGQLRLKPGVSLDFEDSDSESLEIAATDSGSPPLSLTKTFTVTVTDRNDPPDAIDITGVTLKENISGARVGTLSATDQDPGQTHTFTTEDERFEIVAPATLRLKPGVAVKGATVSVVITVTDSGVPLQSTTQTLVINVVANPRPWQNVPLPRDTSADGRVVPLDALAVINQLNDPTILATGGRLPESRPETPFFPYYDVNGDGICSPVGDVLPIINFLNNGGGEGEETFAPDEIVEVGNDVIVVDTARWAAVPEFEFDRSPSRRGQPGTELIQILAEAPRHDCTAAPVNDLPLAESQQRDLLGEVLEEFDCLLEDLANEAHGS